VLCLGSELSVQSAAVCLVSFMCSFQTSALSAAALFVYAFVVTVDLSVNGCSGTVKLPSYLAHADTFKVSVDYVQVFLISHGLVDSPAFSILNAVPILNLSARAYVCENKNCTDKFIAIPLSLIGIH
jgi:hypothetical protein